MSAGSSEPIAEHERFMAQALELAEKGRGHTSGTPLVGCIVVKDDEVIGEGWRENSDGPPAEVSALEEVEEEETTVYVTLEPCIPICTDALIHAKVRRIVIAMKDPTPGANGIKTLQDADIEVITGVLQSEAEQLNEVTG